jgi:hypothetical protein
MNAWRWPLYFLLCIAIPVQGIAGTLLLETTCPMEHHEMDVESAESHSCCNDAETYAKTGKTCKTGEQCQSALQYPAYTPITNPVAFVPPPQFLPVIQFIPSFDPPHIWRPPALV